MVRDGDCHDGVSASGVDWLTVAFIIRGLKEFGEPIQRVGIAFHALT